MAVDDGNDESQLQSSARSQLLRRRYVGASEIGTYELQEKLGEGTFGVVWKGLRRSTVFASTGGAHVKDTNTGAQHGDYDADEEERLVRMQGLKVRRGDVVALKQIILHNETDGVSNDILAL